VPSLSIFFFKRRSARSTGSPLRHLTSDIALSPPLASVRIPLSIAEQDCLDYENETEKYSIPPYIYKPFSQECCKWRKRSPVGQLCSCGHSDRSATKTSSSWHLSAESASYDSPGQSDAEGGASPWVKCCLCSSSLTPLAAVGGADCGQWGNGTYARPSPFYALHPKRCFLRLGHLSSSAPLNEK
jgi:hypothetical protein